MIQPVDSDVYVRNLCALWATDPRLAMALEAVHPDDVPAVERAREGGWTVRVSGETEGGKSGGGGGAGGGGAGGVYLHSRYRPVAEGETWAASLKSENRYAVFVSGFGLGYHIRALFARIPEDALMIISEPNLGILKAGLMTVELEQVLKSKRVMIFTDLDRGLLVERLEPHGALLTVGDGMLFAEHPVSKQIAPHFHRAFQKLALEFVDYLRTGFTTMLINNVATCRNIANNLGRYVTTPPIDSLRSAFTGMPAVLVAAGPSLQKNMHLLHELKGDKHGHGRKAVIIAVQTMLKPLLAAGIQPDFVTSLDYNTVSTRFFENLEESGNLENVHLVAQPGVHWNVLDVFSSTMSLAHSDFAAILLEDAFPPRGGLKAGATVAHLSFYLAEFLGCDPIILTGQDLGFVDGLYYKPGTAIHETWGVELCRFNTLETKEWERIVRSRLILRKIPDVNDHPMYTEEQFYVYLQQFERDFAVTRCKVIDATEGGAKKRHVTVMTLRKAIDEFCGQHIANRLDKVTLRPWKTWNCDLIANMELAIKTLKRRVEETGKLMQLCESTIPVLNEMVEHQRDKEKMRSLFFQVDKLRSQIGDNHVILRLASHFDTRTEHRKIKNDLLKNAAKSDPFKRQRLELLRDIDYVSSLNISCKYLIGILEEAVKRLDCQILAVQSGKPWPREVAGA